MVIKSQIRNINKKNRIDMKHDEVIFKSEIITEKFLKSNLYQNTYYLLAYSSIQNEVDLSNVIVTAIHDNKKVYLPRVTGADIEFFRINSIDEFDSLKVGSFKILEPAYNAVYSFEKQYDLTSKCTILVPGVGFSDIGQRIGFGKGYYDRFLSKYNTINKVGICYDWQITDSFNSDEFDIDMDIIITDKREVYRDDKLREYM